MSVLAKLTIEPHPSVLKVNAPLDCGLFMLLSFLSLPYYTCLTTEGKNYPWGSIEMQKRCCFPDRAERTVGESAGMRAVAAPDFEKPDFH